LGVLRAFYSALQVCKNYKKLCFFKKLVDCLTNFFIKKEREKEEEKRKEKEERKKTTNRDTLL
jgi:hypothetical protein